MYETRGSAAFLHFVLGMLLSPRRDWDNGRKRTKKPTSLNGADVALYSASERESAVCHGVVGRNRNVKT